MCGCGLWIVIEGLVNPHSERGEDFTHPPLCSPALIGHGTRSARVHTLATDTDQHRSFREERGLDRSRRERDDPVVGR